MRRETSVITERSMAEVVSRNVRVCALINMLSRSSGESSGPKARPISACQESSAVLRPRSVAMPTRSGTYPA